MSNLHRIVKDNLIKIAFFYLSRVPDQSHATDIKYYGNCRFMSLRSNNHQLMEKGSISFHPSDILWIEPTLYFKQKTESD